MKHQKLDFFFHQTSIHHHHHHHHHHYRHHHYRSSIFIIICSPFRATFRVARKPKSLLSSRRHRIPEKRASASRESAIYHSSSFVPCSSAGSMYLLVSACSFFCRSSTDAILHKLSDLPKSPGGALGYFLGGYVPPGTPNWHPVLEKIFPKN